MTEQVGGRGEGGEMPDRGLPDAKRDARSPGVFVTGTGTGVGKTVVAAVIARTLVAEGRSVAVFKPVVTGLDDPAADAPVSGDTDVKWSRRREEADHELLRRAAGSSQSDEEVAPYRFGPPVSPHLASELADTEIDPSGLVASARAAAARTDALVCEGVGGLLVPLTQTYLVRDLAADLGLSLVIAACPGLGTINHTLLTVEAARDASLEIAGVVLTPWPAEPGPIEESNRETIATLGAVEVQTLRRLDLADPTSWPQLTPSLNRLATR